MAWSQPRHGPSHGSGHGLIAALIAASVEYTHDASAAALAPAQLASRSPPTCSPSRARPCSSARALACVSSACVLESVCAVPFCAVVRACCRACMSSCPCVLLAGACVRACVYVCVCVRVSGLAAVGGVGDEADPSRLQRAERRAAGRTPARRARRGAGGAYAAGERATRRIRVAYPSRARPSRGGQGWREGIRVCAEAEDAGVMKEEERRRVAKEGRGGVGWERWGWWVSKEGSKGMLCAMAGRERN